jgi:hypothetical protein
MANDPPGPNAPQPDHDLRGFVPGEPEGIRSALCWLSRLERKREEVGRSLLAAHHGEKQNRAARAVLQETARERCLQFAELLYDPTYESVVAPHITKRLMPVLLSAADAAHRLADAAREGTLGDEAAQVNVDGLKAPQFELRLLEELLEAALAEKKGGGVSTPGQALAGSQEGLDAFVGVKTLWVQRSEFKRASDVTKFLAGVPHQAAPVGIRNYRKGQRRMVHAADWLIYFAEKDRKASEALDDESAQEILADVAARQAQERQRKRGK